MAVRCMMHGIKGSAVGERPPTGHLVARMARRLQGAWPAWLAGHGPEGRPPQWVGLSTSPACSDPLHSHLTFNLIELEPLRPVGCLLSIPSSAPPAWTACAHPCFCCACACSEGATAAKLSR